MPVREGPAQPAPPPKAEPNPAQKKTEPYPAQKARGGEIVLRTPLRRAIFIGALVGIFLLLLVLRLLS